jgi:hypothetical protein
VFIDFAIRRTSVAFGAVVQRLESKTKHARQRVLQSKKALKRVSARVVSLTISALIDRKYFLNAVNSNALQSPVLA